MSGRKDQRCGLKPDGRIGCLLDDRPSRVLRRKGDWRLRAIEEQVYVVERLCLSGLSYEVFSASVTRELAEKNWLYYTWKAER